MPHFIVEEIEFDFSDSQGELPPDEQQFITDNVIGLWHVDSEDELIDTITDKTGWCIKSIKYVPNQPHPLTGYM